jgi:hypothetical protein
MQSKQFKTTCGAAPYGSAMRPLILAFLLSSVLTLSSGQAFGQIAPTHYDLTIDIRPSSHDFVASGRWVLPSQDVIHGSERSRNKSFTFLSSEKLLDLKLSLDEKPIPFSCRPADNQLKCEAEFNADSRKSYTFQLSYHTDGKPAPQIRIDSDQAFAGSSGDYWYPQLPSSIDTAAIVFRTPKDFLVVAPGRMRQRTIESGTAVTAYEVDTPVQLGFAAAPFIVERAPNCTIYLLAPYAHALDLAQGCTRAAGALTRIWGPFPGSGVAIVEVNFKGILLGVSEAGYILADSSEIRKPFDLLYWAHELSHQWWGVSVHAKWPSPAASLLTEGMAEFGALSVSQDFDGDEGLADYLSDRHSDDADGAPLMHYMRVLARHEDVGISDVAADPTNLHYIATSKGPLVIAALSRTIGEEQFRRFCQQYLRLNAGHVVTWAHFQAFLEKQSGKDLSWFYSQWFDQAGLPLLYTTWKVAGDGIDVTLHQCGSSYRLDAFPLQFRSEAPDGQYLSKIFLGNFHGPVSTVHFGGTPGVYSVNPDPQHLVPWLPGLCS